MDIQAQERFYGRPFWQWLLMYLVIGILIYAVVYLVWIRRGPDVSYTAQIYWAENSSR